MTRRRRDDDDDGIDDVQSEDEAPSPSSLNGTGSKDGMKSKSKSDQVDAIQIIELESHNPLVHYQGQVYSCTWNDMVGTNMFFNRPGEEVVADPLSRTKEYDLIGTSRIKLTGHHAKLTEISKGRKRRRSSERSDDENDLQTKQQINFLDRLMDIKQARGETDNVAVVVDNKQVINGRRTKELPDQMRQEITNLNRRILKGDEEARNRLLEINAQFEEADVPQLQPDLSSANHSASATPNIPPLRTESPNDHS